MEEALSMGSLFVLHSVTLSDSDKINENDPIWWSACLLDVCIHVIYIDRYTYILGVCMCVCGYVCYLNPGGDEVEI